MASIINDTQKAHPSGKHVIQRIYYRSLRSVYSFLHSSPFYPTPNRCFTMFFSIDQTSRKVSVPVCASAPSSNNGSLDPPDSAPQTASRSVQPFFAQLTTESPYTLQWAGTPPPLKITPLYGGSEPSSNTGFFWPTRVNIPNGITIGSAAFARLTVVTDRPTDRPRYSVCSSRPHLASAAIRPNNNSLIIITKCGLKIMKYFISYVYLM